MKNIRIEVLIHKNYAFDTTHCAVTEGEICRGNGEGWKRGIGK